jgi:hypothetical protein
MKRVCKLVVGIATIAGLLSTLRTGSPAQTVIDEWATANFQHRLRSSRQRSFPMRPRCW